MSDQKVYWSGTDYVLDFSPEEREVLHSIAEQMRGMIADNDPDTYRSFPPAYMNDLISQEEYRNYMGDELIKSHMAALDVLQELSMREFCNEDDLNSFMRAVNNVRLALGTRLDIDEDFDVSDISPDDPELGLHNLYFWLGWLQEDIVSALGRTVLDHPPE